MPPPTLQVAAFDGCTLDLEYGSGQRGFSSYAGVAAAADPSRPGVVKLSFPDGAVRWSSVASSAKVRRYSVVTAGRAVSGGLAEGRLLQLARWRWAHSQAAHRPGGWHEPWGSIARE